MIGGDETFHRTRPHRPRPGRRLLAEAWPHVSVPGPGVHRDRDHRQGLERAFGPPYQVGVDSGDPTWRWFYAERRAGSELTKDLHVRFNANGTVKSYSFSSNFPDDMQRLR